MIIDLRMEHLSLWLLGFEKKSFIAAPEKPRGGAGDGIWPQQRRPWASCAVSQAMDQLPGSQLLSLGLCLRLSV